MAVYTIQDTTLTDIADAIREKTGKVLEVEYPMTNNVANNISFNIVKDNLYRITIVPTELEDDGYGRLEITWVDKNSGTTYSGYYGLTYTKYVVGEPTEFIFTSSGNGTIIKIVNIKAEPNSKIVSATLKLAEVKEDGVLKNTYKPSEMANAISELQLLPESVFNLTGDCQHMFRNNKWNWLIEQYGDKITTNKITTIDSMFYGSTSLKEIPFVINMEINSGLSKPKLFADTFLQTPSLLKYPQINITGYGSKIYTVILDKCANEEPNIVFGDTVKLVGFDYDSFSQYPREKEPTWLFDKCDWEVARNDASTFGTSVPVNWSSSYYIKSIPSMPKFYTLNTGSYYHHWYQFSINQCHNLKEIVLPRPGNAVLTSSPTGFNINSVPTLKSFKFDVQEDNTPYTAQWKNITLSLTNLGWGSSSYANKEKQVSNNETYLQLKDDDEYWTSIVDYSGYNHDRAVETINSLPDTSAYGTNTIRFKGISGSKTDGGAINTLTEEEIAVAITKGWTVSLV